MLIQIQSLTTSRYLHNFKHGNDQCLLINNILHILFRYSINMCWRTVHIIYRYVIIKINCIMSLYCLNKKKLKWLPRLLHAQPSSFFLSKIASTQTASCSNCNNRIRMLFISLFKIINNLTQQSIGPIREREKIENRGKWHRIYCFVKCEVACKVHVRNSW